MLKHCLGLALCLFATQAWGQIDPSSAVLLRSGAKAPEKEQLDRGRYTIRQGETIQPKQPASAPELPKKVHSPAPKPGPTVSAEEPKAQAATTEPTSAVVVPPRSTPILPESLTEQVKEIVMGGSEQAIESYRDRLHADDLRNNLMEIELAPAYIYTESSSNYWFRSYSLSSPGFMVAAQIWITPFFGIRSSFINSMDSSIYDAGASRDRIAAEQQWFDGGFRWRKFFGASRKASTLSLGLDFSENKFHVPKSATARAGLKTVGAKISIEATLPRSHNFSWSTGALLIPRADHTEKSTSIDLRSGARDESTVLGLWVGGNHVFSRQAHTFWRLQHTVERNLFEKAASTADPVTGSTPTGVSVTTGTTMFIFGFRWGH